MSSFERNAAGRVLAQFSPKGTYLAVSRFPSGNITKTDPMRLMIVAVKTGKAAATVAEPRLLRSVCITADEKKALYVLPGANLIGEPRTVTVVKSLELPKAP